MELHLALTQSGVGDDFKMVVPIYAELADGRVVRFGTAPMEGSNTMNIDAPLGIKQAPKAITVSYFYDVLGTVEQSK